MVYTVKGVTIESEPQPQPVLLLSAAQHHPKVYPVARLGRHIDKL